MAWNLCKCKTNYSLEFLISLILKRVSHIQYKFVKSAIETLKIFNLMRYFIWYLNKCLYINYKIILSRATIVKSFKEIYMNVSTSYKVSKADRIRLAHLLWLFYNHFKKYQNCLALKTLISNSKRIIVINYVYKKYNSFRF